MAGSNVFKFLNIFNSSRLFLNPRPSYLYCGSAGIKQDTQEKLKKLKIPEKPKKPLSPYFRFLADYRPTFVKENPNLRVTEIASKCAQGWKNLSVDTKRKYEKEYKSELEAYTKKNLEYEAKLTEEQKNAIKLASEEKKAGKKKRQLKKLYRETEKPKQPIRAFMLYVLEQAKLLNKTPIQIMTEMKEKWANLSPEQKAKYQQEAEARKLQYEKDMDIWEKKMIDAGRTDLIRGSSQALLGPVRKPKVLKSE